MSWIFNSEFVVLKDPPLPIKNKNFNLGIRASDIELNDNGFEFEVELAEISGSETLLHLKRGDTKIITSIEEVMNFKIHDKL